MQNFIVLGLVPGTHLQITFFIWLIGAASLLLIILGWIAKRKHVMRNWLVAVLASRTIRHSARA